MNGASRASSCVASSLDRRFLLFLLLLLLSLSLSLSLSLHCFLASHPLPLTSPSSAFIVHLSISLAKLQSERQESGVVDDNELAAKAQEHADSKLRESGIDVEALRKASAKAAEAAAKAVSGQGVRECSGYCCCCYCCC